MKITLLALLTTAAAWEVAFYDEQNCNSGTGFNYYVYSGPASPESGCNALGQAPASGTSCSFFTNGGNDGPFDCSTGSFSTSTSFAIHSGNCYFSTVAATCVGNGFGSTDNQSCQEQGVVSFVCSE